MADTRDFDDILGGKTLPVVRGTGATTLGSMTRTAMALTVSLVAYLVLKSAWKRWQIVREKSYRLYVYFCLCFKKTEVTCLSGRCEGATVFQTTTTARSM